MVPDQQVDKLHEFLVMQVSLVMVAPLVFMVLVLDKRDATVHTALILSRLMVSG